MENQVWYRGWRQDAVHQLQEKNARLNATFKLGDWQRFDYDINAGTLVFSEHGAPRVIAEIQIMGTTSFQSGNWLWAWANTSLPPNSVADARLVRAFGEEHRIPELTQTCVENEDLNGLGWELTAIAARVTNAAGSYRPPRNEGGGIFLTLRRIAWAA